MEESTKDLMLRFGMVPKKWHVSKSAHSLTYGVS